MLMAGRLHRNKRVKWLWARSSSVDASDRQQLPRWTLFPSLTVATVERAATAAKRKRRRQKIEAATRTPSGTRQPKTTTRVLTWKVISLSSLHLFTFPPFRRFSWNTKKKAEESPGKEEEKEEVVGRVHVQMASGYFLWSSGGRSTSTRRKVETLRREFFGCSRCFLPPTVQLLAVRYSVRVQVVGTASLALHFAVCLLVSLTTWKQTRNSMDFCIDSDEWTVDFTFHFKNKKKKNQRHFLFCRQHKHFLSSTLAGVLCG